MTTNGDLLRSANDAVRADMQQVRFPVSTIPVAYASCDPPHWILGDPQGRRVAEYRDAVVQCGGTSPQCIDWDDFIDHGRSALQSMPYASRLRIDSFGQRSTSINKLIAFGSGNKFPEYGQIVSLHHQYRGLCKALSIVADWLEFRPDVQTDLQPADICVMFDKWASHCRMPELRPATVLLPETLPEFERELCEFISRVGSRVFIKPRYGSSASGVCCYRFAKAREQLIAAIELNRDGESVRLFNSRKIRSYIDPRDIRDIFAVLCGQGTIAETAVRKARVDGDRFDLRIVVVAGQATHLVVRQSSSPITNLRLGNRRGDLDAVVKTVGKLRIDHCRDLAMEAARRFPRALHCGVDVLLPSKGSPVVCEVNAFGDLLPNLIENGQTVYQAIYKAGRIGKIPIHNSAQSVPRPMT